MGGPVSPLPAVVQAAPAKINLALHVTGQAPDGYHIIESLVAFTAFGDTVQVSPAARDTFTLDGPFASGVPASEENLVLRALKVLRHAMVEQSATHGQQSSAYPARPDRSVCGDIDAGEMLVPGGDVLGGPVSIHLRKQLPIASGVGGGSSDAAASLRALNLLWSLSLPREQLARIGGPIGADVPMCVHAQPLIARGVGEMTELLEGFPSLDVVLVNPGVPVATPSVFKALVSKQNEPLPPLPSGAWTAGSIRTWLEGTRNDLEAPAIGLAPEIAEALAALSRSGALLARMSGSGATCFGLFDGAESAAQAAASLRQDQPSWWVQATRTAPSPVHARASHDC